MKIVNPHSSITGLKLCNSTKAVCSQTQQIFIQTAIKSRSNAKMTNKYRSVEEVMSALENKIRDAKKANN